MGWVRWLVMGVLGAFEVEVNTFGATVLYRARGLHPRPLTQWHCARCCRVGREAHQLRAWLVLHNQLCPFRLFAFNTIASCCCRVGREAHQLVVVEKERAEVKASAQHYNLTLWRYTTRVPLARPFIAARLAPSPSMADDYPALSFTIRHRR